ncbi:hypothetical protein [Kitasatospora purpeofusca]|uniref:hypothetical protein n=1 Tax=Kitasatospora purpeofusca TaxID=67352 RepID=UPI00365CEB0C
MSYPDPFDETSPWDEQQPTNDMTPTALEAPVTTPATTPLPAENVTLSFKGGAGYDASLLVLRAGSVGEMNSLLHAESATLKSLLEQAAKVQSFNTGLNAPVGAGSAPKRFENGRVTAKTSPSSMGGDDCPHGRKLTEKGSWAAMFCQAREKPDQCPPLWRQKDGTFKAG